MVGVGGQGSLSASKILGEAAVLAGQCAVVGEIHGMSQRGGIVTSTVRIGKVYGPIISQGSADVLIGFEPLETWRTIGMAHKETIVLVNTRRIIPSSISSQSESYPDDATILDNLKKVSGRILAFDATQIALKAGEAMTLNAVMLGALFYSFPLPLQRTHLERAMAENVPPHTLEINKKAFSAGLDFAKQLGWNRQGSCPQHH